MALPELLLSYRVDRESRLALLATTVRWLGEVFEGSGARVRVRDASPVSWAPRTADVWATSGLDVEIHQHDEPLLAAYDALLASAGTSSFALQFDDTITVGMTPRWLRAATGLLEAGLADAVCPPPRREFTLDAERRRLTIVPFARNGDRFRFAMGGWQRPLATVRVDDHEFAIFATMMWGFYFNNLVAPVADYRTRLRWYADHVRPATVHQIELAAFEWKGPVWQRIAVPIDGVALLDLDFDHTPAAVRHERPEQRALWEAVDAGWDVAVAPSTRP